MVDELADGLNERTAKPLGQAMSLGGDPAKLAAYYADWAQSYDADVGDDQYGLPASVLHTIRAAAAEVPRLADPDLAILDAGCGTGRIAMVLAAAGYVTIDGVDLSPEMVELAAGRGIYRTLESGIDLSVEPPARWRQQGELVVVGGVFTVGHIPPESLYQVAKLVRPGGVLVVTVRPGYYDTTDFAAVNADFANGEIAEVLAHFDDLPYTADSHGLYWAYRILGS